MEFVPYENLAGRPNIVVDGLGNDSTVLALSHWPRSRTPWPLKADTSAEIVFNFLNAPDREHLARGATLVSNNHFDEDGVIALWSLLNPDRALAMRDLLVDIATAGDFSRYRDPVALQAAFTISAFADPEVSPYRKELAGRSEEDRIGMGYQMLMFGLPDILAHIADYRELWEEEFDHVRRSEALLRSGEATILEHPEVDLAVVESPEPLHPAAVCSATDRLRILTGHDGMYWLKYRYESWVQFQTRVPMPRIDLDPLATRLQVMEKSKGNWVFEGLDAITPNLTFLGEDGAPGRSSIPDASLLEELRDYLETHSDDEAVQWRPYDDKP